MGRTETNECQSLADGRHPASDWTVAPFFAMLPVMLWPPAGLTWLLGTSRGSSRTVAWVACCTSCGLVGDSSGRFVDSDSFGWCGSLLRGTPDLECTRRPRYQTTSSKDRKNRPHTQFCMPSRCSFLSFSSSPDLSLACCFGAGYKVRAPAVVTLLSILDLEDQLLRVPVSRCDCSRATFTHPIPS